VVSDGGDIVRVASKVRAFRADFPPTVAGIVTWFTEDVVGDTSRVVGHCRITDLATGCVMAEAHGTRALREPIPNAQGHRDTRDPDRAMTQATGRALGLLGYADGESLEGDTDEPDSTGVTVAARPPMKIGQAKTYLKDTIGKDKAVAVWEAMGLVNAMPWSIESLDAAVVAFDAQAEPFDAPAGPVAIPPVVDRETGEVLVPEQTIHPDQGVLA
jgi:hypothetical protein